MDVFNDYSSYTSKDLYREWRWQEIRGKKFSIPLCNCSNGSGPGEPWKWHAHSRWKCKTWKRPTLPEGEPTYCNCDLSPGRVFLKYDGHWKDGYCEEHMRRRSVDEHAKRAEHEIQKQQRERIMQDSEMDERKASVDSDANHMNNGGREKDG
ncbi:hypothetical protein BDV59DRAFT_173746 [Aspergillus ambiguus]|uniref:uncharacterized protein n=1 Tax=Aspergillus ambiguus TaxID=176160 RepID=UPI003CCD6BEB